MKQSDKALIMVVDENDEIIGHKVRAYIENEDIYRVSALWVTNSRGEILLAQRKFTKKHDPGKWATAVAGTVEKGESYDESIVKETRQEIGVDYLDLHKGPHVRVYGEHTFFCQWYTLTIDRAAEDFVIEEEAVEQVRWISREKLWEELEQRPELYLDRMGDTVKLFE